MKPQSDARQWHAHLGMMGDDADCVRLEYKGETILSAGRVSGHITSGEVRRRHRMVADLLAENERLRSQLAELREAARVYLELSKDTGAWTLELRVDAKRRLTALARTEPTDERGEC